MALTGTVTLIQNIATVATALSNGAVVFISANNLIWKVVSVEQAPSGKWFVNLSRPNGAADSLIWDGRECLSLT